MKKEIFDPSDVTQEEMNYIADHIENYIDTLENLMIIPDDMKEKYEPEIDEGIARTRKLIRKLRKGKKSVFNDEYDYNLM